LVDNDNTEEAMRYLALACDYDGTLAHHGHVDEPTLRALEDLLASGRKLILVTGRELNELLEVFPHVNLFAAVVAENGALIYRPGSREEKVLAEKPPESFVEELRRRGVGPLSVGRVIVATWKPQETTVLEVIRELGLELQVIFNKDAVMVLPAGVNKASGLRAALGELGLSPHNVVGVGDGENDHAFLNLCECEVAVDNALPMLKDKADFVTRGDHGAGVRELIEELVATDLADREERLTRHHILLGRRPDGATSTAGHSAPTFWSPTRQGAETDPKEPVASGSRPPAGPRP
jgi:HAD superfamily hydrolase (TIGR01484 family)